MSYSRIANATLPSPQLRFTSEFEMESGGSTALLPPGKRLVFNNPESLYHYKQYTINFVIQSNNFDHQCSRTLKRCMVKPHGQLV